MLAGAITEDTNQPRKPLATTYNSADSFRLAGGFKCRTLVKGPLKARYYYLLAVHEGVDGFWEGFQQFCVSSKNFSIKGRENCRKRGYERIGFFEVDTANQLTWVQNLSD